jgi:hypothetical protein
MTYLRRRWAWWALIGAGWLAAVLLIGAAERRDLPGCRSFGFLETQAAIRETFYWGILPALVAASASLLAAIFCRPPRRVFLVASFGSLLLAAFCLYLGVGTGLSCALD